MSAHRGVAYRRDIDGLRAVAIVPVVLFHAGLSVFGGGYVGVDVFFVISGYLITSVLLKDIDARTFTIAQFYERRIRRIVPAFVFMVAICAMVATRMLLPEDLEGFGRSLWAATLSVSNITFWLESGDYFGINSDLKPLLHTWSLGVEEQFYICFPLFLTLVYRDRSRKVVLTACACIAGASLALSLYATRAAPVANFYLLPTRAWELLAGAILATELWRPLQRRWLLQLESVAGLILIGAAVFWYLPDTPFPGIAAVPPVLGAALLIHAGSASTPGFGTKMLGCEPLRSIGLISYSLYLWHWPMIVFIRYWFVRVGIAQTVFVIVASTIAAVLSWRFVEAPFRRPGTVFDRRGLFMAACGALAILSASGFILALVKGWPDRVPVDVRVMASKSTYHGPRRDCGGSYAKHRTLDDLCILGAEGRTPDFLVVGDSHAEAVAAAIFESAAAIGRSGFQVTDTGYRPLLGFTKIGEQDKYRNLNSLVTSLLDSHKGVRWILVPMYWRQAALLDTYSDSEGNRHSGVSAVEEGLTALASRYPERKFLLIVSPANSELFGGGPAARARWNRVPLDASLSRTAFDQIQSRYAFVLEKLGRLPNVQILRLAERLCDANRCYGNIQGDLAYSDDNHISFHAARLFAVDYKKFLKADDFD